MTENRTFEVVLTQQEKNLVCDILEEVKFDFLNTGKNARTQYVRDMLQGDANQIEFVLDKLRESPLRRNCLSDLFVDD
jgi:hypothetical protein